MPKKGSAKDPWALVAKEDQDAIAQSSPDEIKRRIANVTLLDLSQREMEELDEAVSSAKTAYDNLVQPYREDRATNKKIIAFCKYVLGNKGKDTSGSNDSAPSK